MEITIQQHPMRESLIKRLLNTASEHEMFVIEYQDGTKCLFQLMGNYWYSYDKDKKYPIVDLTRKHSSIPDCDKIRVLKSVRKMNILI